MSEPSQKRAGIGSQVTADASRAGDIPVAM